MSGSQLVGDLSDLIDRFMDPLDESQYSAEGSHTPRPGEMFASRATPHTITAEPVPASETSTAKKRFTFLIDLEKHIEKNYPLRKEKARTFIAGLHDAPGVQVVCVGLGRKSVEEHMSGMSCSNQNVKRFSYGGGR